jgi:hypothetical protein
MRKSRPLHFAISSYPLFGRSRYDDAHPPKSVTASPYYWWFKFLQINSDYASTTAAGGNGPLAELYADFGDLRETSFKQWWDERSHLFAEPQRPGFKMRIANAAADLAPFNDSEVVNLVVPLTSTAKNLRRNFKRLILSQIKPVRGVDISISKAKYRINGKWNADAMAVAYKIYALKEAAKDAGKVAWADIGIRAGLPIAKGLSEKKLAAATSDQRRIVTAAVMRHYKRAQSFVKASATCSFPH